MARSDGVQRAKLKELILTQCDPVKNPGAAPLSSDDNRGEPLLFAVPRFTIVEIKVIKEIDKDERPSPTSFSEAKAEVPA